MAKKLLDEIKKQEGQNTNNGSALKGNDAGETRKNRALHTILSKDGAKDKQISAKVNGSVYAMFSAINKAQGLSNNSALNMIITKYVRENKGILDED